MAKGSQVERARVSEEEALAPTHIVKRPFQGSVPYRAGDLVLADEWINLGSMEENGFVERLFDHATAAARQRVRAEIRLRELDEAEALALEQLDQLAAEATALRARVDELRRVEAERVAIEARIKDLNRTLANLRSGLDQLPARRGAQSAVIERACRVGAAIERCPAARVAESGR